MALTRKLLKGMGLTDEQIDTVIEAHTDTVTGLQGDIATQKKEVERLQGLETELETLKANGGDYKTKYEKIKAEYDTYKADITNKEARAAKAAAYRGLLADAGISDKHVDAIIKVTDLDALELVDGKFKGEADVKAAIKTEWSGFIPTTEMRGIETPTPPINPASKPEPKSLSEALKQRYERTD